MNESKDIEKPCVALAKKRGWMNRKLDVGPGAKGWLDQIFFGKNGRTFIVEFKVPFSGRLSLKQKEKINRLQKRGHFVYVCRSVEAFVPILNDQESNEEKYAWLRKCLAVTSLK